MISITPLDRMPKEDLHAEEFECTPEMFVAAYTSLDYVIGSWPKLGKNGRLVPADYCFGDLHRVAQKLFPVAPPVWGTTPDIEVQEWRNATHAVSLCLETPKTRKVINTLLKEWLHKK
jgi:hypothetical protein